MSSVGWTAGPSQHPAGFGKGEPPPVPNYRLIRPIGRGSFGEVWLALDAMNKWAAVKVVWWREEDEGRAYRREFEGLKRYDDLSGGDGWLMPIKNVSCDEQRRFFSYAMELADDARTLLPLRRLTSPDPADALRLAESYQPRILSGELRRRGRLGMPEVLEIGLALCQSLERLHGGRLLHRDIKPSNIIFVGGQPKLADIGLVAAADATIVSMAGTSGFVPLVGAGGTSGDIFALGKVLYMMATGNRVDDFPKECADFADLEGVERTRLAELRAVFDRACDPDPEERQPTATVLREELELLRANASVLHLRALENLERTRSLRRRRWRIGLALGIPIVAVVLGFLGLGIRQREFRYRALVTELEKRQLFRIGERDAGWSTADWRSAQRVAGGREDEALIRQAIRTLSGVDTHLLAVWPGMEATSAAFAPDGRIVVAGFGESPAWLITGQTNRHRLPVVGEGRVAWTADHAPLVLQQGSNAFVLRELLTGGVRREFRGIHGTAPTPVLSLSADGCWVVGQFDGGTGPVLMAWDADSGEIAGERAMMASGLQISPDNQFVAVGHPDGSSSVLQLQGLEPLMELPAVLGNNPVQALAFGRNCNVPLDGSHRPFPWRLATGGRGTGIAVWDLTLRAPIAFCRGSAWEIQAVAFSPDGGTLASSGRVGVRLWDALSGRQLLFTEFPGSSTRALAFDPSGQRLLVGSTSEYAPAETYLWEVEPHRGIQRLSGLTTAIRGIAMSPDGRWLAAFSDEWKLAVWNAASGRLAWCFEIPVDTYADSVGVAFSNEGGRLGVASGNEVRTIDLATGQWLGRWVIPLGQGKQVRFHKDGRLRVASVESSAQQSPPRQWVVHEFAEGAKPVVLRRQLESDPETMNVVASPDGERLLITAWDASRQFNHVRYVDLGNGRVIWARRTDGPDLWNRMLMDPLGEWCSFRTRSDGPTVIASLQDGQSRIAIAREPRLAALAPSGEWYATQTSQANEMSDTLLLQRVDGLGVGLPMGTDGRMSTDAFAFSQDGQWLAWGCVDGSVALANIERVRAAVRQFRASELSATNGGRMDSPH